MSARMSWAALLSNFGTVDLDRMAEAFSLSRADRHRVVALRQRPVEDWSWLARRRSTTARHSVREAYLEPLIDDRRVIRSGLSAVVDHRIGLRVQRGDAELYLAETDVEDVLSQHLARRDPAGRVIVHTVADEVFAHILAATHGVMTAAAVSVDLAESIDIRTRRAGYELILGITRA
jgi:hypothetical protein